MKEILKERKGNHLLAIDDSPNIFPLNALLLPSELPPNLVRRQNNSNPLPANPDYLAEPKATQMKLNKPSHFEFHNRLLIDN